LELFEVYLYTNFWMILSNGKVSDFSDIFVPNFTSFENFVPRIIVFLEKGAS
jgi:hypothetical protein